MTSYNPMAWVVKRTKLNLKKGFFWDTLICMPKTSLGAVNFMFVGKSKETNLPKELQRQTEVTFQRVE